MIAVPAAGSSAVRARDESRGETRRNGDARPLQNAPRFLRDGFFFSFFFLIRPRFVSGSAHISLAARDFASQPGKRRSDVSLPGSALALAACRATYALRYFDN
jgi:hypothetical protein